MSEEKQMQQVVKLGEDKPRDAEYFRLTYSVI